MISWGDPHSLILSEKGEYIYIDYIRKEYIEGYLSMMDSFTNFQKDYIIKNFSHKSGIFLIKYTEKYCRELKLNELINV